MSQKLNVIVSYLLSLISTICYLVESKA